MDSINLLNWRKHGPRYSRNLFILFFCTFLLSIKSSALSLQDLQIPGCNITYDDSWSTTPSSPAPTNGNSSLVSNVTNVFFASNASIQAQNNLLQTPVISTSSTVGVECQNITAELLLQQFDLLRLKGVKITSVCVKDSNLSSFGNLPQSVQELRKLVFSNTSIDLEVLKEGSESLSQLSTLEIINEKISNIPQNFFQEMQSLKELRLENDEIASLDADAFRNLDDSLEVLTLRKNRFNRFPMAVINLAQLTVLDLSENDIVIDTQDKDLPDKLEKTLLQLRELRMSRFNCTCEFGWSPFFEWIAETHISGARCNAPEKFKSQEIIVLHRDELCKETNASAGAWATNPSFELATTICMCLMLGKYLSISFSRSN